MELMSTGYRKGPIGYLVPASSNSRYTSYTVSNQTPEILRAIAPVIGEYLVLQIDNGLIK